MPNSAPFYVRLHEDCKEIVKLLSAYPEEVGDDWFPNAKVEEIAGISRRVRSRAYQFLRAAGFLSGCKPLGLDYQQMLSLLVFRKYVVRGEVYAAKKLKQFKQIKEDAENGSRISNV